MRRNLIKAVHKRRKAKHLAQCAFGCGPGFTHADIGKTVCIKGDDVKIDGVSRIISWGNSCHHNCSGTIQSVDETPKGRVQLEDGESFENGQGLTTQQLRQLFDKLDLDKDGVGM